ncbi:MAG: MarR family transcriptional regulator [Pseudomonadota bacterium]
MTDTTDIELIDHIGVDLWAAAEAWKTLYTDVMVEQGYGFFGGAGFAILQFIGPSGARPADVARRMGISRQAVQQLVDALEYDGVVERVPDPEDRRGKRIKLTKIGADAHRAGNAVKRQIEDQLRDALGPGGLTALKAGLRQSCAELRGEPSDK